MPPPVKAQPATLLIVTFLACAGADAQDRPAPCTDAWFRYIEERVGTGDGRGHGPDPGSDEWRGTVEFRLGIRGDPGIPERMSPEWCRYIDALTETAEK